MTSALKGRDSQFLTKGKGGLHGSGTDRGERRSKNVKNLYGWSLAVDVVVGSDGEDGHVEAAAAVGARQALLVVHPVVDVHLLRLK